MAKDYAKKPTRNAPRSASIPAPKRKARAPRRAQPKPAGQSVSRGKQGGLSLKWILSLAAVGGFVGFIAYLNSLPTPEQGAVPAPKTNQNSTTPDSTANTKTKEKEQGFKFYDMLPDSEVVPPQVDEYTPGPGQTQYDYLVQTGSFRVEKDAERQRAQIAFQGLRAYVSQIDIEEGNTWFRVNVGPFTSRSQMNSAVDKLVSINIEPLIRKIPKEDADK